MTFAPGPAILIGLPMALGAGWFVARRFGGAREETPAELRAQAVVALAMAALYFAWHPGILVDDAGFIVRYLLQSDRGCWYCFNAADGPMFGISSFSHGSLSLLLYRAGLGSPERCLLAVGLLGTFASSWLLIRIARRLVLRRALAVPVAFIALFGAKSWMMVGASGMEVPIHSALVLAALFCLVDDRGRSFWLLLALAVISKLDAAPIAIAFGLMHLFRHRASWRSLHASSLAQGLVWAGIPLALWVAFAVWYFGSPLPHSAAAKLLLHRAGPGAAFPFLDRYLNGAWLRVLLGLFVLLWPMQVAGRGTKGGAAAAAPGWGFVSLLALYYSYNPAERMEWYYALPDLFLVLQVLIGLQALDDGRAPIRRYASIAAILGVGGLCLVDASRGVAFFTRYLRSLEGERYAAGRAIAARLPKDAVLMSGHGLLSAWSPGRVIDYSGLNSEITLKLGGDWNRMVRELRPDALVVGGYEYYLSPLQGEPYRIDASFYEIADEGSPPWHLFRREDKGDVFFLGYERAETFSGLATRTVGSTVFSGEGRTPVWTAHPRSPAPRFFRVGIRRPLKTAGRLVVRSSFEGAELETSVFEIPVAEERPDRSLHWQGIVVPLDERFSGRPGYRLVFSMDSGEAIGLYDPIVTRN